MVSWNFNSEEYKESSFKPIEVGNHRVRINNAEECKSKNGNDMIKLTLDVSNHNESLFHYIVFVPDNTQFTNQKLGEVFESFGITPGDLDLKNWLGKVGACRVKHDTYNGEPSPKVSYFLKPEKAKELPAWVEPENKASVTSAPNISGPDENELPF